MRDTLFTLWFIATASYAIPVSLCAMKSLLKFRRCHNHSSLYLGVFMLGASIEAVNASMSLLIWMPDELTAVPYFAIDRIIGRAILSASAWLFALYLFGIVNGKVEPKA